MMNRFVSGIAAFAVVTGIGCQSASAPGKKEAQAVPSQNNRTGRIIYDPAVQAYGLVMYERELHIPDLYAPRAQPVSFCPLEENRAWALASIYGGPHEEAPNTIANIRRLLAKKDATQDVPAIKPVCP